MIALIYHLIKIEIGKRFRHASDDDSLLLKCYRSHDHRYFLISVVYKTFANCLHTG